MKLGIGNEGNGGYRNPRSSYLERAGASKAAEVSGEGGGPARFLINGMGGLGWDPPTQGWGTLVWGEGVCEYPPPLPPPPGWGGHRPLGKARIQGDGGHSLDSSRRGTMQVYGGRLLLAGPVRVNLFCDLKSAFFCRVIHS